MNLIALIGTATNTNMSKRGLKQEVFLFAVVCYFYNNFALLDLLISFFLQEWLTRKMMNIIGLVRKILVL